MSDNPYALLISHAERWAAKAKRPLDADLLSTALNLRDFQDRVPGTAWPAGSADYLMTVRWPKHGPLGVPDVDALVDTLDSFWRFLRATGRLASGSAEPKELAREARRSKERMRDNCASPESFGINKVLQSYGEEIGISLEGADTIEELQGRLEQITTAWNELPQEERLERMPLTGGAGSASPDALSRMMAGVNLDEYATDDELSDEEDPRFLKQDDAEVIAAARRAPYFKRLDAFLDWVGEEGCEVTSAGWLRPAIARELIERLSLDEWHESIFGHGPGPWRSSADHLGIDALFTPAVASGLLEYRGNRVVSVISEHPEAFLRVLTLVSLYRVAEFAAGRALLGVVLGARTGQLQTRAELQEWWRQAPDNPSASNKYSDFGEATVQRFDAFSDQDMDRTLAFWSEAGVITVKRNRVEVTALGIDFARVLVALVGGESD